MTTAQEQMWQGRLYIIQDELLPATKVGHSMDPLERLKVLQSKSNGKLYLRFVAAVPYLYASMYDDIACIRLPQVDDSIRSLRDYPGFEWYATYPEDIIEALSDLVSPEMWLPCNITLADLARGRERAEKRRGKLRIEACEMFLSGIEASQIARRLKMSVGQVKYAIECYVDVCRGYRTSL